MNFSTMFPGKDWKRRAPESFGINSSDFREIENTLKGRGFIVKDGYVIYSWGDTTETEHMHSSTKTVFSTLLFFAVQEGFVKSIDEEVINWGWNLKGKDKDISFRHLADMTSGYMRPEGPGEAWAYNDYAINLYKWTLERVFDDNIHNISSKYIWGPLSCQDFRDEEFPTWVVSLRDWARLGLLWLNGGNWNGKQLLSEEYFNKYIGHPDVPKDLLYSQGDQQEDYLEIGTWGGETNQLQDFGPGAYGFNFWCNTSNVLGPLHETAPGNKCKHLIPGLPDNIFLSSGLGGRITVVIPDMNALMVTHKTNWPWKFNPADPEYINNVIIKQLYKLLGGEVKKGGGYEKKNR